MTRVNFNIDQTLNSKATVGKVTHRLGHLWRVLTNSGVDITLLFNGEKYRASSAMNCKMLSRLHGHKQPFAGCMLILSGYKWCGTLE